jgi:hypothetical protein
MPVQLRFGGIAKRPYAAILTETLVVDIVGSVDSELENETAAPTDAAALGAESARLRTEQNREAAAIAERPRRHPRSRRVDRSRWLPAA